MNDWNFKDFIQIEPDISEEFEIRNCYFFHNLPIAEITKKTGKTKSEIYRVIKKYGKPNRRNNNVKHLLDNMINSDMNAEFISDTTGYSKSYINRLKNRKNK